MGRSRGFRTPGFFIGLILLVVVVSAAIVGPVLVGADPYFMAYQDALLPPSSSHLFGTDEFGRDILVRSLLGLRLSLAIAVGAVFFGSIVGMIVGTVGAFNRGWLGEVIMRTSDIALAFPPIIIALAIVAFWGAGPVKLAIAIGLVQVPRFARLVNSSVRVEMQQEYVTAAHALGSGLPRIALVHLTRNVFAPIIVELSLGVGTAVLTEAGLSYLGLGTPPPLPSLGRMIGSASGFLGIAPWLLLAPSALLSATIIALNLLGDALRDRLDPQTR